MSLCPKKVGHLFRQVSYTLRQAIKREIAACPHFFLIGVEEGLPGGGRRGLGFVDTDVLQDLFQALFSDDLVCLIQKLPNCR